MREREREERIRLAQKAGKTRESAGSKKNSTGKTNPEEVLLDRTISIPFPSVFSNIRDIFKVRDGFFSIHSRMKREIKLYC